MSEKKPGNWKVILVGLSTVLFIGTCIGTCDEGTKTNDPPKEVSRKERIEKAFSSWDGSHRNLEAWVKSAMNDPDSYKHIETVYREKGPDTIFVMMQFSGKNAFGGVVKNTATCYTDLDGNILGSPSILK